VEAGAWTELVCGNCRHARQTSFGPRRRLADRLSGGEAAVKVLAAASILFVFLAVLLAL
jgi:hypothetical protein